MDESGAQREAGTRQRVLITGAGGVVGTALRRHLGDGYDYRLFYYDALPELGEGDQAVRGDIADFGTVLEATAGVDVIVHLALAKVGRHVTWAERARNTVEVDMRGLYNVYEAARLNKVAAVVFASSNHATGLYEQDGEISRPDSPLRPDSIYGAGKAFGEALGRLYADRHGVRVYCIRIANFNGKDEPGRRYEPGLARWLSPRDLGQLVGRCIAAEHVRFGIFYGVSRGGEKKWDLSNAREILGYDPVDDGSLPEWRARYPEPGRRA
jgi:nucleoside-diphosphate-sugar epimerase